MKKGFSMEQALALKGFPKSAQPIDINDPQYSFVEYDESRKSYPKDAIVVVPNMTWVVKHSFRGATFFVSGSENPESDDEYNWYLLRYSFEKKHFSKWYSRGANKIFKPSGLIKIEIEKEDDIMEKVKDKNTQKDNKAADTVDLGALNPDIIGSDALDGASNGDLNDIASQLDGTDDFNFKDSSVDPSKAFDDQDSQSNPPKQGKGGKLTEEEKARRKAKREADELKRKEQAEEFNHAIQESLENTDKDRPNLERLQVFNQTFGVFFGYIPQNDNLFKVTTKKVYEKDANGNNVLIDTAPDDIKRIALQPNGLQNIDKSYFSFSHDLGFKDVAPGKVLGAVIGIPRGGLIDLTECQKAGGAVTPDETKTDLVIDLYSLDEAIDIISILFGQRIKESPKTFGSEAGWVVTGATRKTSVKDGATIKTVTSYLKPEKRKIKICKNAYLPLTTYEKKVVDGALKPEEAKELALSTFFHLYQSGSGSSTEPKASLLSPAYISKIRKNSDGSFESDYFAEDPSKREAIKVSSCFSTNKEDYMPVIEVPLKTVTTTKTSHKEIARYRSFNVTDPTKNAHLSHLGSLNQVDAGQKFHVFYTTVGASILTVEKLKTLTARKGSKGKTSNELSNDAFQSLILAKQTNKFKNVEGFAANVGNSQDLNAKILRARMAVQGADNQVQPGADNQVQQDTSQAQPGAQQTPADAAN